MWILFPGKNFFSALVLVIVLFTNFFTISRVYLYKISFSQFTCARIFSRN